MLGRYNPISFPSFIASDAEPQLLIKLHIFVHCRVLATCFVCNVVSITYSLLSNAQPLWARVISMSGKNIFFYANVKEVEC
jgi:hypothetical protein